MEAKIAEEYPLLNDYDFISKIGGKIGTGVLLIPKNQSYVSKVYGFGPLHLVPYLQEPFNDKQSIDVGDLIRELQEEGEFFICDFEPNKIFEKSNILYSIINRFRKHGIITLEKKAGLENTIDPRDILIAGENYDKSRVLELIIDNKTRHVPKINKHL